ncbi:FAD-dependent oxidoreductase [Pseudorhodoplanes sinuspersici]
MLGYLLGRAGIDTIVLEKHADFLRDFRGDTVHPSTMQVMDELGLLQDFLKRPHQRISKLSGEFGRVRLRIADFTHVKTKCPFVAFMPQWDFLDFIADAGERFPSLKILKRTEVVDLQWKGDTVTGVVARTPEGELRITADLTVGCDGRHSIVRERAGLEVEDIGAPIDVLWFRIGKSDALIDPVLAHAERSGLLITLDRGNYWQCAYAIPKGQIEALKARGLPAFKNSVVSILPALAEHIDDLKDWDDIKLLTVTINRLKTWSLPGLLCIGDAAHAMSPVGGVGINLAIQDAVATANILAQKLRHGAVNADDLDAVRARRLFPVKVIQAAQVQVQNRIISPVLQGGELTPPLLLRIVNAVPWLQGMMARGIGFGVRPEHVRSPECPPSR